MATGGVPIAGDDDADRAIAAASQMQSAISRLNEKWTQQGRPEITFGIGINYGEVFAGNIGSDLRLEYTVIGDAVNTASRLCSQAGRGQILVSEPFYRALKVPPKVEPMERLQLKGKKGTVPVYRVMQPGS